MRNSLLDPVNSGMFLPVPDDILICILRRLDVIDISRCRCVCKRWKEDLTSNPQFEELILRPLSNLPMILAKYFYPPALSSGEFCIDKWWIKSSRNLIHKVSRHINLCPGNPYYGSQNGFIVNRMSVDQRYEYIVRNPMTSDEVKIVLREKLPPRVSLDIIGIYLHPIRREYCILWRFSQNLVDDSSIQYKMLNLGSTKPPLWRNIGHPWTTHWWHDDYSNAVYCLNDGFIYWLVNGRTKILAFDIKTELLTEMPLPIRRDRMFYPPSLVINDDGCVSLVKFELDDYRDNIDIKILTLKDGRFWTSTQHVCYQNPSGINQVLSMSDQGQRAVAIANGELVFQAKVLLPKSVQLFVCNLNQSGTMRNLGSTHPETTRFWAHYPTIASLRNCHQIIHILPQDILQ